MCRCWLLVALASCDRILGFDPIHPHADAAIDAPPDAAVTCTPGLPTPPLALTGDVPRDVVAADFDGDGKLDLAVTNYAATGLGNTVSVLLGTGNGAFAPQAVYATGPAVFTIIAPDLNGDGHPDLVVGQDLSSANAGIDVLVNHGGTFPSYVSYPNGQIVGLVAGDFNEDGKVDIAGANYTGNNLAVWLGNGDGTLRALQTYPTPSGGNPYALAAGDLDGDHHVDLVETNFATGTVSVLRGNGDGTFGAATSYPSGSGPAALAIVDLDGDGHLDVVVANFLAASPGNSIAVLLGNGDGTLAPAVGYPTGVTDPVDVRASDFDGDGKPDVAVVGSVDSYVAVLRGDGTGKLAAPVRFGAGLQTSALMPGDFNGDGKLDLAVTLIGPSAATVLTGHGDGTFDGIAYYATQRSPLGVSAGDLDGDGKLDLAVANYSSDSISIFLQNGNRSFAGVDYPVGTAGAQPYDVAFPDIDGDGHRDLVASRYLSGGALDFTQMLNHGDGTFAAATLVPAGSYGPIAVATGDLDGDGHDDVVAADFAGSQIAVLLDRGGALALQQPLLSTGGNQPRWFAIADFDHDGHLDLAVTMRTSAMVGIFLGTGGGSFGTPTYYAVGAGPVELAAGDVDHDGDLDLVVANADTTTISVLLNAGDATFAPAVAFQTGQNPFGLVLRDVDRDGNLDVIAASFAGDKLSVLLGRPDGSFAPPLFYESGAGASAVAAGDLDGDGFVDFAVANYNANTLSVLYGRCL